jgi:hypothetical protein
MRRLAVLSVAALLLACALVSTAQAAELDKYAVESVSASLSTTQAGAHPDFTTHFVVSSKGSEPYALTRDISVKLPTGIFGNPQPFPTCTTLQLGSNVEQSKCPQDSQVGFTEVTLGGINSGSFGEPIYNMPPPGGDSVARFGLFAGPYPATIVVRLDPNDHSLVASVESAPAAAAFIGASTTFWGVPALPSHDLERITPLEAMANNPPSEGRKSSLPETPFMTNPTSCETGRQITVTVTSYQLPEAPSTETAPFPNITGCGLLGFSPKVDSSPTTEQATTGSGLDYRLDLPTKGIEFSNLLYDSEQKRAEVVLPEGMTVNPSEAEGLGVCSEADLAKETYNSAPNAGCPETAKIGSVTAVSPALNLPIEGSLYLAKPYQNPFGSLLALYMVLKVPERGVLVKLAGKVSTDPKTGQITTVFDDIPQLPVASFKLHFREGARAPLVTPPACGTYQTLSHFNPYAAPGKDVLQESPFSITSGVNGGPCPSGGLPPFKPGLLAGTINNAAGSFSPFNVKLTRTDAEQEITHFSIKLPPGIVAKLAGVPYCSDQAIEAAKARTGPHGGEEELASPSCPAASEVGHTLAGAGVGSVLTYVPGKVYLAGPYHGSKLSIVAITAAKAGPFDLGTVVVRDALQINPETAEVFVDATGSDPIPHIIQGIPVHLRDIRAYVDRPEFALNPTDCTPTSTASTVLGSGLDFASEADDNPITVTSPFQAADCAALPFKPQLSMKLTGGTKRGAFPKFSAHLAMNGIGEAGIQRAEVILPHSEFIAQAHFVTICTRVQFKEGAGNGANCPAGSIYGHAKATTPILGEPLEGPVFLRANGGERNLPDLVVALHNSQVDFDLVGFVDSVQRRLPNGEKASLLRNRFEATPDAPVTSFDIELEGGSKGLFENSTNLCAKKHFAKADFTGQNGKAYDAKPVLKVKCKGKGGKHKRQKRHGRPIR